MGDFQKKYKLIAIDLDGTLLSPSGQVTRATKLAVRRCLDAGILICFATGRNWTESQAVLDAVEHYSHAVFVGGAMVIDTKDRVQLHRTAIEPSLAAELCGQLESRGLAALALQDDMVAGIDYLISGSIAVNPATAGWMKLTNARTKLVSNLSDYQHEHTIRVGAVGPTERMIEIEKELRAIYAERVYLHSINVPHLSCDVLEIFDPSVNKWQGILHVASRHGIEPEEIVAIGDDLNDLHMLKNAGLGVAMGNARAEAKAVSKLIIGRNDEDGLATFLNTLVDEHLVEPEAEEAA